MTPPAILTRKIFLKRQVACIIRGELDDLRFQKALLRYRHILSRRIGVDFEPDLSGRLDAIQYLIEALNPKIFIPGEPNFDGGLFLEDE